jgi:hypothetical protein
MNDHPLRAAGGAASAALSSSPGGLPGLPHFAPKAKRVIYLFQSGGPSQLDMWDYKPKLKDHFNEDLPASVRMGQRITGMTSGQKTLPVAPSIFQFAQHGQNGAWISELLPHTAKIVDELCVVRTVTTDAINHDPAVTFCNTGNQQPGRPTMGAWVSYGLGSENRDMPAFVVLTSGQTGQNLHTRYWESGFLPTIHQGVQFRAKGDPVLFLSNPAGRASGTAANPSARSRGSHSGTQRGSVSVRNEENIRAW